MFYFWEEEISSVLMKQSLSPKEQSQYEQLSEKKQPDWLAGRIAAKHIISQMIRNQWHREVAPIDIEIISDSHTRPDFRILHHDDIVFHSEYSLSLSHTKGKAIAGLSLIEETGYVGVDIEHDRECTEAFSRSFLTPKEYDSCIRYHIPFLQIWCYKEAFLKAIGAGLALHPHAIETTINNRGELLSLIQDGQERRIRSEKLSFPGCPFGAILYVEPYGE